jgi:hypothetical protein
MSFNIFGEKDAVREELVLRCFALLCERVGAKEQEQCVAL